MKKWIIFSLLVLSFFILFLMGYLVTKPKYEITFFTPQYIEKYKTPEDTFIHYINSLRRGEPEYYQEVLGRKISQKTRKYIMENPFKGELPKIIRKESKKDYVFIITDNNWGINLERVMGRWVFSSENINFLYRELFRALGIK